MALFSEDRELPALNCGAVTFDIANVALLDP
jgi:hypothetical protein